MSVLPYNIFKDDAIKNRVKEKWFFDILLDFWKDGSDNTDQKKYNEYEILQKRRDTYLLLNRYDNTNTLLKFSLLNHFFIPQSLISTYGPSFQDILRREPKNITEPKLLSISEKLNKEKQKRRNTEKTIL
jgi:hypothetical protein